MTLNLVSKIQQNCYTYKFLSLLGQFEHIFFEKISIKANNNCLRVFF